MEEEKYITESYKEWTDAFIQNPYYKGVLEELNLIDNKLNERLDGIKLSTTITGVKDEVRRIKKLLNESSSETLRFYYNEYTNRIDGIPSDMYTSHLEVYSKVYDIVMKRVNEIILSLVM